MCLIIVGQRKINKTPESMQINIIIINNEKIYIGTICIMQEHTETKLNTMGDM